MPKRKTNRDIAVSYMEDTSIHGCRYVVLGEIPLFERIIWGLIIICCFVICGSIVNAALSGWDAKPVLTTVDSVAAPFSEIRFPTVTICTNQIKKNFDPWRIVDVAFQMIEDECLDSTTHLAKAIDDRPANCTYYLATREILLNLASSTLPKVSTMSGLRMGQIANLVEFQLEKDDKEEEIFYLHRILAKMFGDTNGRVSPIAIPWLLMESKSSKVYKHRPGQGIFDNACTRDEAVDVYSLHFKNWVKEFPSTRPSTCQLPNKSPCCHYVGNLLREKLDFALLCMKYAIPNFFEDHSALANFLGFDPTKEYKYLGNHVVPYCRLPAGNDMQVCSSKDQTMFWTTEGLCTTFNSPPMHQVYKNSSLLDRYNTIFNSNPPVTVEPYNATSAGSRYTLRLLIDTNSQQVRNPYREPFILEETYTFISINQFANPFSVFYTKSQILPGNAQHIKMTPLIAAATDALRSLDISQRRCRFQDEAEDMKLFQ